MNRVFARLGGRHALLLWLALHSTGADAAEGGCEQVRGIGVYTVVATKKLQASNISLFLAGYLSNVKNYTAHNLDQYYVKSEEGALRKAAELGLDAVLVANVVGFKSHGNSSAADLRLVEVESAEVIHEWAATFTAPYFDPPTYRNIEPYGNLDDAFAALPEATYPVERTINLLVVSDQRLRGSGKPTREYLQSQLEVAGRVLLREFGIQLVVQRIKRWSPPAGGITGIANAAATIPGRDEVDLTLVCIGPPAPHTYWGGPNILGYARVLTNIVVNNVMNAHVFVHEISHVLGAIHVADEGCIMQPALHRYELAERFEVLPPMLFSETNRRIMEITRLLPLGTDFEDHREKIARLLATYEELQEDHLAAVAPYHAGLLLSLNEAEAAVDLLEAGLKGAPNDRIIRSMLGEALNEAGRYAEAQRLVQEEFDMRQAALQEATDGGVQLKEYAAIHLSRTMVSFRETKVGGGRSETVTIVNQGTGELDVTRFGSLSNPFSLGEDETPFSVGPGETVDLEIFFEPGTGGLHQGTLEVFSNSRGQTSVEIRISGRAGG